MRGGGEEGRRRGGQPRRELASRLPHRDIGNNSKHGRTVHPLGARWSFQALAWKFAHRTQRAKQYFYFVSCCVPSRPVGLTDRPKSVRATTSTQPVASGGYNGGAVRNGGPIPPQQPASRACFELHVMRTGLPTLGHLSKPLLPACRLLVPTDEVFRSQGDPAARLGASTRDVRYKLPVCT